MKAIFSLKLRSFQFQSNGETFVQIHLRAIARPLQIRGIKVCRVGRFKGEADGSSGLGYHGDASEEFDVLMVATKSDLASSKSSLNVFYWPTINVSADGNKFKYQVSTHDLLVLPADPHDRKHIGL